MAQEKESRSGMNWFLEDTPRPKRKTAAFFRSATNEKARRLNVTAQMLLRVRPPCKLDVDEPSSS